MEVKAAKYLFGKIRSNNPEAKEPNFQSWALEFDRIFRIDKRDADDVRRVIDWCQADSFWLTNILSPQKLRKQYDRLKLAMKAPTVAKMPVRAEIRPTTYASPALAEFMQRGRK